MRKRSYLAVIVLAILLLALGGFVVGSTAAAVRTMAELRPRPANKGLEDGFVAAAHVHPKQEERFEVVSGTPTSATNELPPPSAAGHAWGGPTNPGYGGRVALPPKGDSGARQQMESLRARREASGGARTEAAALAGKVEA